MLQIKETYLLYTRYSSHYSAYYKSSLNVYLANSEFYGNIAAIGSGIYLGYECKSLRNPRILLFNERFQMTIVSTNFYRILSLITTYENMTVLFFT